MKDGAALKTGVIGSLIAAICCFTLALALLLAAVGLTAWIAWLDYVLLPILMFFFGLTAYGLVLRQRRRKEN